MGEEKSAGSLSLLMAALQKDRVPPAFLFVGPSHSGKETTALAFSRSLLGSEKENHPDRIVIAPDQGKGSQAPATLKIEQIRELLARITLKPLESSRLVVIMKEAEKMTLGAANALLKIIEEPPPHVHFILLTETAELLPATVRSRCQRFLFEPAKTGWQPEEGEGEEWERYRKDLLPFFREGQFAQSQSFFQISQKAEEWSSFLPSLLHWLRLSWHDFIVYRETGEETKLLLREQLPLTQDFVKRRTTERLFRDFEEIDEATHALEAHVQKTLLLEQLFAKLAA